MGGGVESGHATSKGVDGGCYRAKKSWVNKQSRSRQ